MLVVTAANGDTVTAVQTGTGCFTSPTTASATATYSVTGGSGRFSGATGSGTATTNVTAVAPGILVGPALNQMLATGDSGPVTAEWSQGQEGSTMHPIGGPEIGRDEVLATWKQAGPVFSEGRSAVDDLEVIPLTEDVAYTIGTERFEGKVGGEQMSGAWRATNIYHREDGGWKIVHHHCDAASELQDLLRRLQTQAGQATG